MGTLSTAISSPNHSKVFVFGSVLNSVKPNDLDVLAVYDEAHCPPTEAFIRHRGLKAALSAIFDLPVHLTLLTESEESNVRFIERTGAIQLDVAIEVLTIPLQTTSI